MKKSLFLLSSILMIGILAASFGYSNQEINSKEKVGIEISGDENISPKEVLTDPTKLENIWLDEPIPLSEYTEEEIAIQLDINQQLGKVHVLTYNHLPDELLYDNSNYSLPIAERNIDNEPITPYTWKVMYVKMDLIDGNVLNAQLRRPNWWVKHNNAEKVGSKFHISIHEMGIEGEAEVVRIGANQIDTRIKTFDDEGNYTYRPITGWFERVSNDTWDYEFSNGEVIGSTSNHPYFSEDRQNYIAIGEIEIGERIKVKEEKTAKLVSKTKRGKDSEKVYNLEVYRDHNFHVGEEGLLVHNSCAKMVQQFKKMNPTQRQKHLDDGWDITIKSSADVPPFFGIRRYFQDLMEEFRYKAAGFKGTAHIAENFKAIDFYKEISVSGNTITASKIVSMKTTKATNVNTWKNYQSVKDNIQNIKDGLSGNQGIAWNGKVIKYSNPEIHIYMPKDKFTHSIANTWKTTLENLHPEIKFEITTLEKHIK